MTTFRLLPSLALLCCMLLTTALAAAPRTEVITLDHELADHILPVIQPLLHNDERASAYGNQLIIRAEPERLSEIQQLLTQLDRQPAQIRISVANADTAQGHQSGYQINGRIRTSNGDIIVGHPRGANEASITRRETNSATDLVREIIANEGYPVLIQSGQSIPLTTTSTNIYGQIIQQTQYHNVTAGFYATVRLNGDMATISLSANNDRLAETNGDVVEIQHADTVVTARLGEWINIGAVNDLTQAQGNDLSRRTTTRNAAQQSLSLRIDRID